MSLLRLAVPSLLTKSRSFAGSFAGSLAFTALLSGTLLAAGCTSSDVESSEESTTTTTAAPTAESVLAATGAAMAAVDSLAFSIDQEGANVFIDGDSGLIAFTQADGRYSAPSSADALVAVSVAGFDTEVGAIAVDGEVWITNPLTTKWEAAPDAFSFDPAKIFSADLGIGVLLSEGFTNAVLDSPVPDSKGLFHITAGVDPERVSKLTGGLIDDVSDVEVWIDADTNLLTEAHFVVGTDEGDTIWTLALDDYNQPVTITKPDIG